MEGGAEVGFHHVIPSGNGHGGEQVVIVVTRVVDQHGNDSAIIFHGPKCSGPGIGADDVERENRASSRKFFGKGFAGAALRSDAEIDEGGGIAL